jgi:hypothetical protein
MSKIDFRMAYPEPPPAGEPVNFCVRHLPPAPAHDFAAMNRLILSGCVALPVNSSLLEPARVDRHGSPILSQCRAGA